MSNIDGVRGGPPFSGRPTHSALHEDVIVNDVSE
jgi:hypothetical protein